MNSNRMIFKTSTLAMVVMSAVLFTGCNDTPTKSEESREVALSDNDKYSYAFGQRLGEHVKYLLDRAPRNDLDVNNIVLGISETIQGNPRLTQEESEEFAKTFTEDIKKAEKKKIAKLEKDNLAAAEAFLSQNKLKSDVVTTESGLQFIIHENGTGDKPDANDIVVVNYKGKLLNGTTFDQSDTPANLFLEGVVDGWQEALQLMSPGTKATIFLHPNLAYGTQNTPNIPPNSLLTFEIELIEIVKKPNR